MSRQSTSAVCRRDSCGNSVAKADSAGLGPLPVDAPASPPVRTANSPPAWGTAGMGNRRDEHTDHGVPHQASSGPGRDRVQGRRCGHTALTSHDAVRGAFIRRDGPAPTLRAPTPRSPASGDVPCHPGYRQGTWVAPPGCTTGRDTEPPAGARSWASGMGVRQGIHLLVTGRAPRGQ